MKSIWRVVWDNIYYIWDKEENYKLWLGTIHRLIWEEVEVSVKWEKDELYEIKRIKTNRLKINKD